MKFGVFVTDVILYYFPFLSNRTRKAWKLYSYSESGRLRALPLLITSR